MAFITGNTNEFIVYLTDKGREAFFNNGLKDNVAYFSLMDGDANYKVYTDSSYNPKLTNQDIPTVVNKSKTTNNFFEVFTQTGKRGGMVDNKLYNRGLFAVGETTLKNYMVYEPDLGYNDNPGILTYKTVNSYRQFNVFGLNGIYLRTAYPAAPTLSDLMKNYDIMPVNNVELNRYQYINARYSPPNNITDLSFVGSNARNISTHNLNYSQIIKKNELVIGENYHAYFNFYFRFWNAFNVTFNPTGTTGNLTVNLYLMLGSNKIPMTLSNLQQYRTTGTTAAYTNGIIKRRSVAGYNPLVFLSNSNKTINLNYSEKNYTYLSMNYTIADSFEEYTKAPNGYPFRVTASLDLSKFNDLKGAQQCTNSKDFSILVEYSRLADNVIRNDVVTKTFTS